MKRKKKRGGRAVTWLLAAALVLQIFAQISPGETAGAEMAVIGTWDGQEEADGEYRFQVQFLEGVTKAVPFGCDNKDYDAFTNYGQNMTEIATRRMSGNYMPGSAGIRYYNVGQDSQGNLVDLRLSVMGASDACSRYDMYTPYIRYHQWADGLEDAHRGYAWKDGMGQPLAAFSLDTIGIFTYCVGSVKVKFEFFRHNTEEPLKIRGHGTLRDLDAGQGLIFPADSGLEQVSILEENDHLRVEGAAIQAEDDTLNDNDRRGWVRFRYDTRSVSLCFLHRSRLERWDMERERGIKNTGSAENWAKAMQAFYVDRQGRSLCPEFDGGKIVRGHAYFCLAPEGSRSVKLETAAEISEKSAGRPLEAMARTGFCAAALLGAASWVYRRARMGEWA